MLSDLQALLVQALRAPDPAAALQAALARPGAAPTDAERDLLRSAAADGLRLTRVLVRKLRLQRLLAGDPGALRACRDEPESFARRFAAYDAAVPPTALFPSEEAALWRGFSGY